MIGEEASGQLQESLRFTTDRSAFRNCRLVVESISGEAGSQAEFLAGRFPSWRERTAFCHQHFGAVHHGHRRSGERPGTFCRYALVQSLSYCTAGGGDSGEKTAPETAVSSMTWLSASEKKPVRVNKTQWVFGKPAAAGRSAGGAAHRGERHWLSGRCGCLHEVWPGTSLCRLRPL